MEIGFVSVLDATEVMIEFGADRSWFAVFAKDVGLARFDVINFFDRGNDRCRAACSRLFECFEFFDRNRASFHFQSHVFRQLDEAHVGNGREDGGAFRRDVGVVLDTKEVGGTCFVDVFLFFAVEIKFARITQVMRFLVGAQAGGIVATDLETTCSKGSGAVIFANDNVRGAGKSTFEIRSNRGYENNKKVFVGRVNTNLRSRANEEWSDVKGGSTFVRGNESFVEFHDFENRLFEFFDRQFRHKCSSTSGLHAFCVFFHTEDTDFSVFATIGFQSFKAFLSVVEACSRHVQWDVFAAANF